MKVTIGIPVYRVENYIERCVVSVYEQTYNNLEIIFVDDCSPDNSIVVLQQLMDKYPERKIQSRIVKHDYNRGSAAARNTVVEYATGDFLIWVDADDYIDKTLVAQCVKQQQATNCDIVLFDYTTLNRYNNKIVKHIRCSSSYERTLKLLARQTPMCLWGGFYRLSLYKEYGISAVEGVNNNDDYQVLPRLSYYSRSISYIDKPLYYYDCTNETSITHNFNICQAEQGWKSIEILEDFFKDKGPEYMDALQMASIDRVATYLKWSIKDNNKGYYKVLRDKQRKIGMEKAFTVPLSRRVYLYLKCYTLLRTYTMMGVFVKRLMRKR